jgi:hypothetical protein
LGARGDKAIGLAMTLLRTKKARTERRSAIYENAVDSLRIGFEFFKQDSSYSSHKHAILTIFHAIELFLKERLSQTNSILIYKNIDTRITDDSPTVGIKDILVRFENIGIQLPKDQLVAIERIQKIRNRIEHHRYDHNEEEDKLVIGEALKVVLYFVEFVLKNKLADDVGAQLFDEMQARVFEYNERRGLADLRLEGWMKTEWPKWDEKVEDTPEEFSGTLDCPVCGQSYFVVGYHDKPFCFHCNATIDGDVCGDCGRSFLMADGCNCESYRMSPEAVGKLLEST